MSEQRGWVRECWVKGDGARKRKRKKERKREREREVVEEVVVEMEDGCERSGLGNCTGWMMTMMIMMTMTMIMLFVDVSC